MCLDPVAREIVLENVRNATPSGWTARVEELRQLGKEGQPVRLGRFLEETGMEPADVYAAGRSWSGLCAKAGIPVPAEGPQNDELLRGCGRLLHVDDSERMEVYRGFLSTDALPKPETLDARGRRLLRMLLASVADQLSGGIPRNGPAPTRSAVPAPTPGAAVSTKPGSNPNRVAGR